MSLAAPPTVSQISAQKDQDSRVDSRVGSPVEGGAFDGLTNFLGPSSRSAYSAPSWPVIGIALIEFDGIRVNIWRVSNEGAEHWWKCRRHGDNGVAMVERLSPFSPSSSALDESRKTL